MADKADRSLRRTLTGFASIIALATVLIVAAEYFITAFRYESDRIQATSDTAAATLSRMIYRAPETWLFQDARVTELLSEFAITRHPAQGERHVRVMDVEGDLLFQLGSPPPVPALTRGSDLTDGFDAVGRIEITEGILHVWERTGIATIIGAMLALAMSVVLRTLPLRALMNREEALVEANRAAQASERVAVTANTRLTEAIEALNDAFVLYDSEDRLELCNTKYREFYKALPEFTTIGARYEDLLRAGVERGQFPESTGREEEWLAEQMAEHRAPSGNENEVMLSGRWLRISEWPTQNGGTVSVRTDITARKLAEIALRASEEQLLLVTDAMPALIGYVDSEERFRFVNQLFEKWFQRPREDFIGKPLRDLLSAEHYDAVAPSVKAALSGQQTSGEATIDYPDGATRQVNEIYTPHFGEDRRVRGYFVLVQDITEMRETEQQLLQVQKQEAVGQIAGGIAHDFNNILGIILGNLELLEDDWSDHGVGRSPFIDAAVRATERGADLTQRLLAFSRKQTLLPKPIDVNELISGMTDLLDRTIIESVKIETVLAHGLPPAMVDPGQLENAILNLGINARDAMPDGGMLTIRTAMGRIDQAFALASHEDVAVGDYVTIAVSDTGTGMSPEIRERAFDPFFTTKDVGQGSGLGLSMIHGFAKQSGGHVKIDTLVDRGTTFTLFLPVAQAVRRSAVEQHDDAAAPKGTETILVVEDDSEVKNVAVSLLKSLGYRILQAADGPSALGILEQTNDVDLLFTDLVMPGGMTGIQLADAVRRDNRDLKVLFTSGHSDDADFQDSWKGANTHFIGKPYNKRSLAEKVRAVFDDATA